MTIKEIDIWRMAKLLIDQHGSRAPIVAAQRLDALLATRDLDGRIAWRRIANAVDALLRREAPKGASIH